MLLDREEAGNASCDQLVEGLLGDLGVVRELSILHFVVVWLGVNDLETGQDLLLELLSVIDDWSLHFSFVITTSRERLS